MKGRREKGVAMLETDRSFKGQCRLLTPPPNQQAAAHMQRAGPANAPLQRADRGAACPRSCAVGLCLAARQFGLALLQGPGRVGH